MTIPARSACVGHGGTASLLASVAHRNRKRCQRGFRHVAWEASVWIPAMMRQRDKEEMPFEVGALHLSARSDEIGVYGPISIAGGSRETPAPYGGENAGGCLLTQPQVDDSGTRT